MRGALPVGTKFEVENVVDLEKLLPDCGYKLRSVELEANGRLERIDCDSCDEGEATVLKVTGGGTQLELTGVDDLQPGDVRVKGVVSAPFDRHLQLEVSSIEAL